MTRRPVIAGNWKMNKLQAEAKDLVNGVMAGLKEYDKEKLPEVVVAPVFTSYMLQTKHLKIAVAEKLDLLLKTATSKKVVLSQVKHLLKCWLMPVANTSSSVTAKDVNILQKQMKWLTKKQNQSWQTA